MLSSCLTLGIPVTRAKDAILWRDQQLLNSLHNNLGGPRSRPGRAGQKGWSSRRRRCTIVCSLVQYDWTHAITVWSTTGFHDRVFGGGQQPDHGSNRNQCLARIESREMSTPSNRNCSSLQKQRLHLCADTWGRQLHWLYLKHWQRQPDPDGRIRAGSNQSLDWIGIWSGSILIRRNSRLQSS